MSDADDLEERRRLRRLRRAAAEEPDAAPRRRVPLRATRGVVADDAPVAPVAPAAPPVAAAVADLERSGPAPAAPVGAAWADLAQVGLLGTSRRPVPAAARTGRLALTAPSAEVLLLQAAGATAAWRAAGPRLDPTRPIEAEPAPDDPRPAPAPGASQLLRMLLEGDARVGDAEGLVLRWLERAGGLGLRVGHGELVALLTWASAAKRRHESARPVVGARGAWLAAGQPAWSWALGADLADAPAAADPEALAARFRTARKEERPGLFRAARAADPALGRTLLDEARATDAAAARLELVEALADDLTPDDEPLLESMLDDRASTVRTAVADLLTRLPTSRYGARMAARLGPLVQSSRRSTTVELPSALDVAAARDAIDVGDGPGKRAAARRSIVVGTPLAFWASIDRDPATIVTRATEDLLGDLVEAVVRQRESRWAAALFGRRPTAALLEVWAGADRPAADAACVGLLRRSGADAQRALVSILGALPGPWSPELSRAVLAVGRQEKDAWRLQSYATFGPRLDPAALADLDAWLEALRRADTQAGVTTVRSLRHSVDLRAAIDAALPVPTTVRQPR